MFDESKQKRSKIKIIECYEEKVTGFESPKDWNLFCEYLTAQNRFVIKAKWQRFLKALRATASKRSMLLEKNTRLVRARIGSFEEEYEDDDGVPHIYFGPLPQKELYAPSNSEAKSGRANPRGIAYLYLASKIKTAIAEVRPWIKSDVSIGIFRIKKDLKILDVSEDKKHHWIDFDFSTGKKRNVPPPQEEMEKYIWGDINEAFSIPIEPGKEERSYIPTQFIAEYFKNRGYHGIVYKSSLDESGHNIVIFKPENAQLLGAKVFNVTGLKYEYSENGNPYSVTKSRRRKPLSKSQR